LVEFMNAAYTVPSGATVTAGSQAPADPGSTTGLPKCRPPSAEAANPILFRQPIHSS